VPEALTVLLDQNVPRAIAPWLRARRTQWTIYHTSDVALSGRPDEEVFVWAQQREAVIVTFDEDFADQRAFPTGSHAALSDYGYGPPPSKKPKTLSNDCSRRFPMQNSHGRS
jgi:Domain of unknown function (DUF5615)